jgi:hypothetical protein
MSNTEFIVKVDRGSTRAPEYVQRIDGTPVQTTPNRKLALVMGRFTAEDAVKSIHNSRCRPELVSVRVSYIKNGTASRDQRHEATGRKNNSCSRSR